MSLPVSRFHAAQACVLERQRASEAEARKALDRQEQNVPRAMSALPPLLQEPSRLGVKAWHAILGYRVPRPEFRVGQLDAELLDEELVGLLKGQVDGAFKYFDVSLQLFSSSSSSGVSIGLLVSLTDGLRFSGSLIHTTDTWKKSCYCFEQSCSSSLSGTIMHLTEPRSRISSMPMQEVTCRFRLLPRNCKKPFTRYSP